MRYKEGSSPIFTASASKRALWFLAAFAKTSSKFRSAFVSPLNSTLCRYWFPVVGVVLRGYINYLKLDVIRSREVLEVQGEYTVLCCSYSKPNRCGHILLYRELDTGSSTTQCILELLTWSLHLSHTPSPFKSDTFAWTKSTNSIITIFWRINIRVNNDTGKSVCLLQIYTCLSFFVL